MSRSWRARGTGAWSRARCGPSLGSAAKSLPGARLASVPVATFHPGRLGAPAGQSPEGSPWADLDYALLDAWKRIAGRPDVLSVHVYGNPRLSVADDMQSRHERGWRFGLNVAETWAENHAALGLDHLPVWISEFNTAARGTDRPHRPAVNYHAGWLQAAAPLVAQGPAGSTGAVLVRRPGARRPLA